MFPLLKSSIRSCIMPISCCISKGSTFSFIHWPEGNQIWILWINFKVHIVCNFRFSTSNFPKANLTHSTVILEIATTINYLHIINTYISTFWCRRIEECFLFSVFINGECCSVVNESPMIPCIYLQITGSLFLPS